MILLTEIEGVWWLEIGIDRVKIEIRFKKEWLKQYPKTAVQEQRGGYYTVLSVFVNTNCFYVELKFRNTLAASSRERVQV